MISEPEERDERVMTLAEEALQTPASERDSFLQNACQNDPDLYHAVREVVTWEERMSGFLSRPLIEFVDLESLEKVFGPGQVVAGRFEILRRVGDGGMGVVYEAWDGKRKQRIAIKFAKPGFGRLLSPELEGALKVRHENVCRVNEIHSAKTEFGDLDFLTMEFLDGETLSERLARGKLKEAEAKEIARQLCAGVDAAHRSGVLHRDLKPGNIILCRNDDGSTRAVITDFGLSTPSAAPGETGGGTPSYMAPELRRDGKPSQASDVFSLGVILYEMLTGQKPFPAAAENDGAAHLPIAPSKLVKGLPRRWDKAILPCLQPKPEGRCPAAKILEALKRRPFYQRPTPIAVSAVSMAACIVLAVLLVPKIIDAFTPSPIRLALLPVEAPADLAERANGILDGMPEQLKQLQIGKAMASVISPARTQSKGVTTPDQAQKILHATHALQLRLGRESDGVSVEGAIIDLRTMAHVQGYSGRFAEADLADLRAGLAGFVSWALRLHRALPAENILPAAATAYENGRNYLKDDPADFNHAIPEFQEAARLDPHSPLPPAGLAEAYAREYHLSQNEIAWNNAQVSLAKAEALNADSPAVRIASGLLHTMHGDYPRALDDYQRVEEVDPRNVDAWLGSGFAYELQRKLDKAIADYKQAMAISPDYYKPYEYLGALYYYDGRYDKSEEMYKQDIERAPKRPEGHASLGGVYTVEAKYSEAEKAYKASLEVKETALMLNNIGVALAFQGRQKDAIGYYQRAVAKDPTVSFYWYNLGDTQRRLNDLAGAKRSYQRGRDVAQRQVTANPANALTRAYFAYLLARLGLKDQARSEIAAALNSPSRDDQVLLCAVLTYEALGDRGQALAAAAAVTPQTLIEIDHHPDLAGLQDDSRFKQMRVEKQIK